MPWTGQIKSIFSSERFRDRSSSSPIPLPRHVSPMNYRMFRELASSRSSSQRQSTSSTSSSFSSSASAPWSPPPYIISAFSADFGNSFRAKRTKKMIQQKENALGMRRILKIICQLLMIALMAVALAVFILILKEKMEQRNVQKEVWEMEENLSGIENDENETLNNNSSSRNNENAVNPLSKLLWASLKRN